MIVYGIEITHSEAEDKLTAAHIDTNHANTLNKAGCPISYDADKQRIVREVEK